MEPYWLGYFVFLCFGNFYNPGFDHWIGKSLELKLQLSLDSRGNPTVEDFLQRMLVIRKMIFSCASMYFHASLINGGVLHLILRVLLYSNTFWWFDSGELFFTLKTTNLSWEFPEFRVGLKYHIMNHMDENPKIVGPRFPPTKIIHFNSQIIHLFIGFCHYKLTESILGGYFFPPCFGWKNTHMMGLVSQIVDFFP